MSTLPAGQAPPPAPLRQLAELREYGGRRWTEGLPDAVVARFLARDPALAQAIQEAWRQHSDLRAGWGEQLRMDEERLCELLQADYVNFYRSETVSPYVALAARGPWIVTAHGAVLHDSGGYGMLGMGHAPQPVLDVMAQPWVMANIMTPSFSHKRLTDCLEAEIGHSRADRGGKCPFARFICMNSGSESVTVAARISDINALKMTQPGARHAGKAIYFLGLKGGFHGRTDRPAQASDSSIQKYRENLASFKERQNLIAVRPNDVAGLRAAFDRAEREGVFIESMFMEPVMGEGNPGQAISREFYDAARALTKAHGGLLLVDSIQAGLRATGALSIVDYPGFEDCEPPDMETYSKAINAGQYPLSVLALTERAADLYIRGVYGNTMTTNPRALEVACAVLGRVTPELRQNIRERGQEFTEKLRKLQEELPALILGVQGQGLIVSAELAKGLPVVARDGVEMDCRRRGLGVIHGGENSLRFTPHFAITSDEIDLIIEVLGDVLREWGAK